MNRNTTSAGRPRTRSVASIRARNFGSEDAHRFPLRCGVPLALGTCAEVGMLSGRTGEGTVVCQFTPLTRWHDRSLRCVLVECLVDVPAHGEITLELVGSDTPCSTSHTQADDGEASAGHLSTRGECLDGSPVPRLSDDGDAVYPFADMRLEMTAPDGTPYAFRRNGPELVEERGPVRSTFLCGGEFVDGSGHAGIEVGCRLDVFGAPSLAALEITVHNPRAARHPGGYWDLGDEGSCRFADLSIVMDRRKADALRWRVSGDGPWRDAARKPFVLSQLTSGGTLRESPNHVNAAGEVPSPREGFRVRVEEETVESGRRCSPRIMLDSDGSACILHLRDFWQNFPKAIEADRDRLRLGLFPDLYADVFELQGGEKKTHTLYVVLDGTDPGWFDGEVHCHVDPTSWRAADSLPHLDTEATHEVMDALIDEGLTGPHNFFAKRERIDEYGWRHFGDVHADHETWGLESSAPLSSHYNNQYDLLYGFIRMSVLSGRPEWHRLADDLARHVLDIDLYDTRADRPEYNGGLFWHTDHYRPALTSTHRTYSLGHARADASATGGGPGGEHCYTTGLKLYHLTTGCERARVAVLDLADWVMRFYDGSGTLLEELYRTLRIGTRTALAVLRGRAVSRHRYPVHRGIGNLVVAQLDAFELSGSRAFLDRAERVVLGAVGPHDDLEARGLGDVEHGWFYTIFLQALIRYLDVKRTLGEFDATFFYARDSLMHYADWMAAHERPYLDDPDALEFPNHTWAAQDIRRCAVLLAAYRYAPTERRDLLDRSRFFARYVVSALESEPTSSYTRILAILMQNHGASAEAISGPERYHLPPPRPYVADRHLSQTLGSLSAHHAGAILRSLRRASLRVELRWLRGRLRR